MTSIAYSPGLHKLVTLQVDDTCKLTDSKAFVDFTRNLLDQFGLEQVGIVVHDFDNRSFTIAVCLKESHICVHTWPEFGQLTLDVYLCNYLQDNSKKVKAVMAAYIDFFGATVLKDFEIDR
ncbi:S-adenosylmethionine decarboxylase family protein [Flavobacterium caeni]|uniref:S-adenosylmethionine decarboxylase n=1 Tax=Flavobacterium caeni TaxID=490189 RepID=A0A1G5G6W6_9FLAO|nr:S-adenosylmethionine decarboxylase [Flavobacterium caeni]SCY47366.1 S-adenosylmethionine decarboxylase [Flavobacterium caeni]